jgi:hypothetical protein
MAKRPRIEVYNTPDGRVPIGASYYRGRARTIKLPDYPGEVFYKVMKPILGPFRKSGRFYK